MAGRKPKPTALKEAAGNPGKRPLRRDEPKPEAGIPEMPASLGMGARALWPTIAARLLAMKVLTKADGFMLALLCEAMSEREAALAVIAKEGAYYVTTSKFGDMVRKHPAVDVAADAWKRTRAALSEFGLTPSSRSKIPTSGDEKERDPFEDFLADGARPN